MKTTLIALTAAVTLSAAANTTYGQSDDQRPRGPRPGFQQDDRERPFRGPEGRPPMRPRMMNPLVAVLDADQDRVLSKEEIANASASLAKLDENQDGQITLEEVHANLPDPEDRPRRNAPQAEEDERPRPPRQDQLARFQARNPLIQALDADEDQVLSKEEIANASQALAKLDTNEDGAITVDEFMRPRRGPGQPGDRPAGRGEGRGEGRGQGPGNGPGPGRGPGGPDQR